MRKYKGRFFLRQRVWRCGSHTEVELYPVFQRPGVRRARSKPTRECQRLLNQRDAERRVERTARLNFSEPGSLEVDLTFAEAVEEAQAVAGIRKYIRELRKIYRGAGKELRYLYAKEKGKKSGRWHFHMFLSPSPISRDDLEALWPHGWANAKRLKLDESGLAGISRYVAKQGKKRRPEELGRRRWSCSKNLRKPEPEVKDGEVTMAQMETWADAIERRGADAMARKEWPGLELAEGEAIRNLVNRGIYVRLHLCPREVWNGRPPVARYAAGEVGESYAGRDAW